MSSDHLTDIEHVRLRPSMYIGSTDFFGTIHYLVDAINLILQHSPGVLEISSSADGFTMRSDIVLPIHENENGLRFPFECFRQDGNRAISHGPLVMALSDVFVYSELSEDGHRQFAYRNGSRLETETEECPAGFRSQIRFAPDHAILKPVAISNYNFVSYLSRLSYLHPSTRFSFDDNGKKHVFHSENGLMDMFVGVAGPYQLVHEPIHIRVSKGDFSLEFIFAFQSWSSDVCTAFVNKGRAVEGGTHQTGLDRAIEHLKNKTFETRNGLVGLLSIQHPDVQWVGCIKAKIGNPELDSLVFDSIVGETNTLLSNRSDLVEQIRSVRIFPFPDIWAK